MAWSFEAVVTHTGQRLGRLPGTGFTGARSLNGGEGGQVTIPLTDDDWQLTKAEWDYLLKPTVRTVVACWNNVPVFSGIIWTRKYKWGSGVLQLTLRDVWSVFEGRTLIGPNSTYPSHSYYRFGPAGLPTLADRIVRLTQNNGEALDNLPMEYPASVSGTREARFYGYNAMTVAEGLEQIITLDGGPDCDFTPAWAGNAFTWVMGSARDLNASKQVDINLDGGAAGVDFELTEDATDIVTRAHVFGEGEGRATLSASAAAGGSQEYLTVERIYTGKRTNQLWHLQGWGARTVRENSRPVETADMSIRIDGTPGLADLVPGMTIRVVAPEDPWLAGRELMMRLAGYSFSQASSSVQLDVRLLEEAE
ncbi:hypothetical protein [Zhihengliuella flava]|uniref:Minor tail protein n=1 Tax=Zhihengliuella flava TaxID=1285193 RepID=A0A931D926_9MICC|nr:hypothetical protein [Zhihengliuella flava]MBG6085807.1 hypothetical protein [Zhihengliuella flava]MBG6085885.1 hypothetical protein [Zhihengliuella flava]